MAKTPNINILGYYFRYLNIYSGKDIYETSKQGDF